MADSTPPSVASLLPDSARFLGGALSLAGCPVEDLARSYGTPLYIYDEATIRSAAQGILKAFETTGARVSYAAKACALVEILRVIREAGLDLDTVSAGEIEAGMRAGFAPSQVHLHGNFKSDGELRLAIKLGLRAIVVDNAEELRRLDAMCRAASVEADIMLRLALSVEAETHPYLRTTGAATKFGTPFDSSDMEELLRLLRESPLKLVGVHAHIGSQVSDAGVFARAAAELVSVAQRLRGGGFPIEEVNIGGGWAVPYRHDDPSLSAQAVAAAMAGPLAREPGLRIGVEPGRAVVARASVAVYRVGSVKWAGTAHRVIAVDGGMGDNPRPALYGSRYTAFVAGKACEDAIEGTADVVGRYCEAGDVLAKGLALPAASPGDLLCIPVAGAYQLAMASAYNLVPPPAAIMVKDGAGRLIRRRPTVDSLLSCDQEG